MRGCRVVSSHWPLIVYVIQNMVEPRGNRTWASRKKIQQMTNRDSARELTVVWNQIYIKLVNCLNKRKKRRGTIPRPMILIEEMGSQHPYHIPRHR